MPTFTILNDIHLKPAYSGIIEDITLPSETDVVLIAGDTLDSDDAASVRLGRDFLARLDRSPVPTVVVPGNHDPIDTTRELVADFDSVQIAHERSIPSDALPGTSPSSPDITIIGLGCTQFDAGCEISYEAAESLEFRDEYGRVDPYREARAATELIAGVSAVVTDSRSPQQLCEHFGLPPTTAESIRNVATTAQSLIDKIAGNNPSILLSHVPPFGTDLDIHHSQDGRHEDGLHNGWLALTIAIQQATPTLSVAGHSHVQGYTQYDSCPTHILNGGFRGVTTVRLNSEGFGFQFHDPDWLPGNG